MGFGLTSRLVEMTRPSGVDAELQISALPLLDGVVQCVMVGIVSSLQPVNMRLKHALQNEQAFVDDPSLLFDPQTAGGLLASVPPSKRRNASWHCGQLTTAMPQESGTYGLGHTPRSLQCCAPEVKLCSGLTWGDCKN